MLFLLSVIVDFQKGDTKSKGAGRQTRVGMDGCVGDAEVGHKTLKDLMMIDVQLQLLTRGLRV